MKIKSKIVLFVCAFVLIFSVLSVSCFASVDGFVPGDRYVMASDVSLLPEGEVVTFNASFAISGTLYSIVSVNDAAITFDGDDSLIAFVPGFGWVDADLNPISVDYVTFVEGDFSSVSSHYYSLFLSYFDSYFEEDPDSFYNQIFNSISSAVFGEDELTSEQNLSLSLISTVFSIGLVLLPVLLVLGFLLRCFRL